MQLTETSQYVALWWSIILAKERIINSYLLHCQQDEKKPHTHKQSVTIAIEKNNSLSKHTPKIAKAQQ